MGKVIDHKTNKKSLSGFKDAKEIANEEILEIECDVLIPAALGNQITEENAESIKAKIILEIANGPITTESDKILEKKGIQVIPDILVNAGGVVVSYFEWVQNSMNYYWTREEIVEKLEKCMVTATKDVEKACKDFKCSMRDASYTIAINRVLQAERLRGVLN